MSSHVFRICISQHDGTCLTRLHMCGSVLVTDLLCMQQSRDSMKYIIWVFLQSNTKLTN